MVAAIRRAGGTLLGAIALSTTTEDRVCHPSPLHAARPAPIAVVASER